MEKLPEFSPAYTRYALGLLLAVATFNLIDRSIVNLLLVPIAADLELRDWQLGVFSGPAFGIFYALAQIPIARIADRGKRSRLIALALAFWSAMTMLQSAAMGFVSLAIARAAVAMGEAGSGPASQSILADLFPPSRRGRVFAIFAFQLPVGAAIGALVGGWGREFLGWRGALLLVGIPGLILAVLVWRTLREPTRGYWQDPSAATSATLAETVRFMVSLPSFRHIVIGYSIWVCVAGAQGFDPVFLERSFGLSPSQIGSLIGAAGLLAMAGYYLGGWLSDRLSVRDVRWALRLPTLFLALHLALSIVYYQASNIATVIVLAFIGPLLPAILPLILANVQSQAPPHMRARGRIAPYDVDARRHERGTAAGGRAVRMARRRTWTRVDPRCASRDGDSRLDVGGVALLVRLAQLCAGSGGACSGGVRSRGEGAALFVRRVNAK
jgi:predicted MFS family arabinose efflux permease